MAFSNYTLANGLPVHAVHVSRTDEDGKIQQERFWGTVKQIGDPSQVYVRIDIDELQPMFRELHYGQETADELSRRKRRRTAAERKEKAREEQLERLRRDQAANQRDDTNWEQARIDLWRQKLEERERAVAARESAMTQRELEYRRLERCPLCGKRGRMGEVRRRRAEERDGARQEMNEGAGTTSTDQSTMRALLQMRPCKDDSIKGIDLELGSTFNERWGRKSSVRATTAMMKPGNGRARHRE